MISISYEQNTPEEEKEQKGKGNKNERLPLNPDNVLRGHFNSIYTLLLGTTDATSSTVITGSSDESIRVRTLHASPGFASGAADHRSFGKAGVGFREDGLHGSVIGSQGLCSLSGVAARHWAPLQWLKG